MSDEKTSEDKTDKGGAVKAGPALKYSLLSISLVLTSAYAISAALPAMQKSMPDRSLAQIETLATVPTISVVVMVLLSGWIAQHIGAKRTVGIGLLLVGVGGTLPAFVTSYPVILVSRLVLGAGFGLFNSLAVSLLSHFFSGNEKATALGFQNAFQSIGSAVMTFLAGLLLNINWHWSFLVYLAAFPILIVFWIFVPVVKQDQPVKGVMAGQKVSPGVIGLALLSMVYVCIQAGFTVRIPTIVTDAGYASATEVSNCQSIATIVGMIAGFLFGAVYKYLGHYILALGTLLMGLGQILAAFSHNIIMTGLATVLVVAVSMVYIGTYCNNRASELADANSVTLATSFVLVGCNLGGFMAPYVLQWVSALVGSDQNVLIAYGCFSLAVTVFALLMAIRIQGVKRVSTGRDA